MDKLDFWLILCDNKPKKLISEEARIARCAVEGKFLVTEEELDELDKEAIKMSSTDSLRKWAVKKNDTLKFAGYPGKDAVNYKGKTKYKNEVICDEYLVENFGKVYVDRNNTNTKIEVSQKSDDRQIGGGEIDTDWEVSSQIDIGDNIHVEVYPKSRITGIWGIDNETIEHENRHFEKQDSLDKTYRRIVNIPKSVGNRDKQQEFLNKKLEEFKPDYKNKIKIMHNQWDWLDGSSGPSFPEADGFRDMSINDSNKVVLPPPVSQPLRVK
jgi:hypothetical protein